MEDLKSLVRSIPDFPKPGVVFRDITPLLLESGAFDRVIDLLCPWDTEFDLVAAAESRGFIFAAPLALRKGAGLIPIRKPGKLPFKVFSEDYDLEYGKTTLQMHEDAIKPGQKVLFVDDVLATGGTTQAALSLIEKAGGEVIGCAFLIEIEGLKGRKRLSKYDIISVLKY